jgi:hypothetical protein
VEGFADLERRDIDMDDFGEVLREAADGNGADALLEEAAAVFNSIGFADGLDGDFGVDFLGHGDGLEIDMEDIPAEGVVLDLLDEGELVRDLRAVVDFEVDEDVFANGVGEDGLEVAEGDFEVRGCGAGAVDDGRDGAAGADLLDGVAAAFGAGAG